MTFTRFALGTTRHRKIACLSDAAFRLWFSAIERSREQKADGLVLEVDLDLIPRCPGRSKRGKVVRELVESGLWEELEPGKKWRIHDYLDWQDSSREIDAKQLAARERMRAVRARRSREQMENTSLGSREVLSGDRREEIGERSGGDLPPATIMDSDRETMCPLSLRLSDEARQEMADRFGVVVDAIIEVEQEFVGYWTIGGGAGKKRRTWLSRLREEVRQKHDRGLLRRIPPDREVCPL